MELLVPFLVFCFMNVVTRALSVFGERGKYARMANVLGISPQAIRKWERAGRVPAERVLQVEASTGIPRHELRPDIYPPCDYQHAG